MKKRTMFAAIMAVCLLLSACTHGDNPPPSGPSGGSSFAYPPQNSQTSQPEDLSETFQALVDKVDYSGVFLTDFEPGTCDSTATFYLAGCTLVGFDQIEKTYEYATNNGVEGYLYTPAAIFDAAFQPCFVMTADELHAMMENYDPDIDGYWAPQGGGGIGGATYVTSYEVDGNKATLFCENPIPVSDTHEIQSYAEIQVEKSEEYGWRFVSCHVRHIAD